MFQRLNNIPLDSTTIFNTIKDAQDYSSNNGTAYSGQLIHVKDARSEKDILNKIPIYEENYFISILKDVIPICGFTYETIMLLIEILIDISNGIDAFYKIENLKSMIAKNTSLDIQTTEYTYEDQPQNPIFYNDNQIVLEYTKRYGDFNLKATIEGASYSTEFVTITDNGTERYFVILTLNEPPTYLSFNDASILRVIHMCDTSNLRSMEKMFYNCYSLLEINMDGWKTSNVTSMKLMFCCCYDLVSLDMSSFDVSNVTDLTDIFSACNSLSFINFKGWSLPENVSVHDYGAFEFTFSESNWYDHVNVDDCTLTTLRTLNKIL